MRKGAWRVLKRISHKIKNKMSYINHCIAKELVLMAKERRYGIAIENLKGLKWKKVGKRHRKRLHKWAYRDLIQKIEGTDAYECLLNLNPELPVYKSLYTPFYNCYYTGGCEY